MKHQVQVRLYLSHGSFGLPFWLFPSGRQSLYAWTCPQGTAADLGSEAPPVTASAGLSSILLLVSDAIINSSSKFMSPMRQSSWSPSQLLLLGLFFVLDVALHIFVWSRIIRMNMDASEGPLLTLIPIFSASCIGLLQRKKNSFKRYLKQLQPYLLCYRADEPIVGTTRHSFSRYSIDLPLFCENNNNNNNNSWGCTLIVLSYSPTDFSAIHYVGGRLCFSLFLWY